MASSNFHSNRVAVASDSCAICLVNFTNEAVAVPGSCNHAFCPKCLYEWEKKKQICPMDRKIFITKYLIESYAVYKRCISRLLPGQVIGDIICRICSIVDDDYAMLSCTVCSSIFHKKCLDEADCPSKWKINKRAGLCVNHEICRIFNQFFSSETDGEDEVQDEDDIIMIEEIEDNEPFVEETIRDSSSSDLDISSASQSSQSMSDIISEDDDAQVRDSDAESMSPEDSVGSINMSDSENSNEFSDNSDSSYSEFVSMTDSSFEDYLEE